MATQDKKLSILDEWKRVLQEFVEDIKKIEKEHACVEWDDFAKKDSIESLTFFVRNMLPQMEAISKADTAKLLEKENDFLVLPNLTFSKVWGRKLNESSQQALWKYLHTFYFIMSAYEDLPSLLETFSKNGESALFTKCIQILQNHSRISQQIMNLTVFANNASQSGGTASGSSSATGEMPSPFAGLGDDSAIASLAKEISQEVNIDDFKDIQSPADLFRGIFGGAGGPSEQGAAGIGRLVSKVGEKLHTKMTSGGLDEMKLLQEAQSLMSNMNPMMSQMMSSMMFPGGGASGGAGGFNPMSMFSSMFGGMQPPVGGQRTVQQPSQSSGSSSTHHKKKKRNKHRSGGEKKKEGQDGKEES